MSIFLLYSHLHLIAKAGGGKRCVKQDNDSQFMKRTLKSMKQSNLLLASEKI